MTKGSNVRWRPIGSDSADLQCFTEMLGSVLVDFIVRKMKCRQCLLGLMVGIRWDRREELLSYSIDLQSICKMMDSTRSHLVRIKMDLFQCLSIETIETQRFIREKSSLLTWLLFKASVRYWTLMGPILFAERFKVINVYEQNEWECNDRSDGSCLTGLIFNASERYWTTFMSPIRLLTADIKCRQCRWKVKWFNKYRKERDRCWPGWWSMHHSDIGHL